MFSCTLFSMIISVLIQIARCGVKKRHRNHIKLKLAWCWNRLPLLAFFAYAFQNSFQRNLMLLLVSFMATFCIRNKICREQFSIMHMLKKMTNCVQYIVLIAK